MTADLRPHAPAIEVVGPVPPEVAVGADFVLKVKVSCPAGCELDGMPLKVTAADATVVASALAHETADIALTAPRRTGEASWTLVCGPHESAGILHEATTLPIRIEVIPHATSLAVWAVPSPVVMGENFAIKVGAKSSAGIALTGMTVEVCDEAGIIVARGRLGETPLPGTSALPSARACEPGRRGSRRRTLSFLTSRRRRHSALRSSGRRNTGSPSG